MARARHIPFDSARGSGLAGRCEVGRPVGPVWGTQLCKTNPIFFGSRLEMGIEMRNEPKRSQFLGRWRPRVGALMRRRVDGCGIRDECAKQSQFSLFLAWKRGRAKKQSQFVGRIMGLASPFCDGFGAAAVGWLGPGRFWYNGLLGSRWVAVDQREEIS